MVSLSALLKILGVNIGSVLPKETLCACAGESMRLYPTETYKAIGPHFNRGPRISSAPFDLSLPPKGDVPFEYLSGLFLSTSLDHAVISMTVRQAAYLYGITRQMQARKVIEIGRYKGGATLVLAAAMGGQGDLWSIDIGEKVARIGQASQEDYDKELQEVLDRWGLRAHLILGDSRTVEIDTVGDGEPVESRGDVDLVFIDGDHTYPLVKNDFERFGRRVRVGGAVLLDDAFDEGMFKTRIAPVAQVMNEILAGGDFKLVKQVNRMAHLERIC